MEHSGPSISEVVAIVSLLILAGTTVITQIRAMLKDRAVARGEATSEETRWEVRRTGILSDIHGVEERLGARLDETRAWVSSMDKQVHKVARVTDEVAFNLKMLMDERGLRYHKLPNGDRT